MRVPEIPDRTFPGKVTRIADALAAGNPNSADRNRRSQSGRRVQSRHLLHRRASIPRKTPSLIVPSERSSSIRTACMSRSSRTASSICSRSRSRGISAPQVEVREGVTARRQVVLNPAVNLAEGSKVTVRKFEDELGA